MLDWEDRSRLPLRLLLALGCGATMQFAFSPFDLNWLGLLAMVVWIASLRSDPLPFLSGYAFGIGWFGIGAWWLADTFHLYGGLPYPVAYACVALVGLVLGLFPALTGWIAVRIGGRGPWLLLTLPASAVLIEWLRGHLLTGLPWTPLGHLLLDSPASGWIAFTGVYGGAALPIVLATALALLISQFHRLPAIVAIVVVGGAIALTPATMPADGKTRQAALIQASIPQDVKWDQAFLEETMRRYETLSSDASTRSDLIVWPESAIPFFLSRAPLWDQWLQGRIDDWGQPLLFGGLKITGEGDTPAAQNGLFMRRPGSGEGQFVGKHHLVPFGEYVPSWIPWLRSMVTSIGDWQPADDSGVVKNGETVYGALICYESIFPEEARERVKRGAEALVIVTNDAWYGKSPAAWQHLQAARARAIETGRYVLRAANTGVSAVIALDGTITATMPWWQQGSVIAPFTTSKRLTIYQQWGDMPSLIIAALLLAVAGVIRRLRSAY